MMDKIKDLFERVNVMIPAWFKLIIGHSVSGFIIAFGYEVFSKLSLGVSLDLAIQAGILAGTYAIYKILLDKIQPTTTKTNGKTGVRKYLL
ncbi:MAG: hypothetical protein QXL51_01045 [Candidatus Aenigmatarchaeota archaeon]